ncbi:MAG: hypothetical protein AUJ49_04885 [Desulfovibrionaceae bacterium CG1_02_65_16]|nr:MAG: hypothetical protein AUJ49_04885 [Desulfovibrionaceae bacterium CG1_02_65_16]
MGKLYDEILKRAQKFIEDCGGVDKALGRIEGSRTLLYKTVGISGIPGKLPKSEVLLSWLEAMGAEIRFPELSPQTRDIEFIKPKIVGVENGAPPPESEDYLAVPLAAEAIAAGPGLIPQDEIRGWVVVWRHHGSIRYLTDLVAVEIGKGQTSMEPNLYPGDIVLVNRADRIPDVDGKIMLVCDPDGGCAIKRVSSSRIDGDTELVFYSDNTQGNPPRVFQLKRDYGGDLHAAIGGRVVWAWSDMTRK